MISVSHKSLLYQKKCKAQTPLQIPKTRGKIQDEGFPPFAHILTARLHAGGGVRVLLAL